MNSSPNNNNYRYEQDSDSSDNAFSREMYNPRETSQQDHSSQPNNMMYDMSYSTYHNYTPGYPSQSPHPQHNSPSQVQMNHAGSFGHRQILDSLQNREYQTFSSGYAPQSAPRTTTTAYTSTASHLTDHGNGTSSNNNGNNNNNGNPHQGNSLNHASVNEHAHNGFLANVSVSHNPITTAMRPMASNASSNNNSANPPFKSKEEKTKLYTNTPDGFVEFQYDLYAKLEKAFFLEGTEWTCYRRNYFSCSCYYTTSYPFSTASNYGSTDYPALYVEKDGSMHPVVSLSIQLSAIVVDGSRSVDLHQYTTKRDKGPVATPKAVRLSPRLSHNSIYNPTRGWGFEANHQMDPMEHTFDRLQFKSATANNGKRRAAQQYFAIVVSLIAETSEGNVEVSSRCSEKLIVRGRSPGHYQRGPHRESPYHHHHHHHHTAAAAAAASAAVPHSLVAPRNPNLSAVNSVATSNANAASASQNNGAGGGVGGMLNGAGGFSASHFSTMNRLPTPNYLGGNSFPNFNTALVPSHNSHGSSSHLTHHNMNSGGGPGAGGASGSGGGVPHSSYHTSHQGPSLASVGPNTSILAPMITQSQSHASGHWPTI